MTSLRIFLNAFSQFFFSFITSTISSIISSNAPDSSRAAQISLRASINLVEISLAFAPSPFQSILDTNSTSFSDTSSQFISSTALRSISRSPCARSEIAFPAVLGLNESNSLFIPSAIFCPHCSQSAFSVNSLMAMNAVLNSSAIDFPRSEKFSEVNISLRAPTISCIPRITAPLMVVQSILPNAF